MKNTLTNALISFNENDLSITLELSSKRYRIEKDQLIWVDLLRSHFSKEEINDVARYLTSDKRVLQSIFLIKSFYDITLREANVVYKTL